MSKTLIALAACVLTGSIALPAPAAAQARPALVKNVDEKGRNPYQVTAACQTLQFSPVCFASAPPVPDGKRLVLQFVYATFYENKIGAPFVTLSLNDNSALMIVLPTVNALSDYVANAPLLLYVDAGKQAVVRGGNVGTSGGTVTFTGYLVDLN